MRSAPPPTHAQGREEEGEKGGAKRESKEESTRPTDRRGQREEEEGEKWFIPARARERERERRKHGGGILYVGKGYLKVFSVDPKDLIDELPLCITIRRRHTV